MKRPLVFAALVVAAVLGEEALLRFAAAREVSMSLLAGGGALPLGTLALAGTAMLVRLFVRLVLPGLVAQAVVLLAVDRIAGERTHQRRA
jgi:hypothetical protein